MGLLYDIAVSKNDRMAADYINSVYRKELSQAIWELEILPDFYEKPKSNNQIKVIEISRFNKKNNQNLNKDSYFEEETGNIELKQSASF